MKIKQIFFTGKGKAELLDNEINHIKDNEVLIESAYIPISAGTERANLMRMPNTGAFDLAEGERGWGGGYSCAGIVKEVGQNVKSVSVGDKVLAFWSNNCSHNVIPEQNVVKLPDQSLDLKYAAFAFIASFPAAAIRKTRLEFGESAMVFGLGILGAFAVQLLRAVGAFPIIAADLSPERRNLALDLGADYAFDPADGSFEQSVKDVTCGKGARVIIEVTGQSVALKQALDCVAPLGRVALLGCTRVSDTGIDYYNKVHKPGVTIVGAHTNARPDAASYPHHWTHHDDCTAIMNFMANGRLDMTKILSEVHSPKEASEVYKRLAENKNFPVGVVFDWRNI